MDGILIINKEKGFTSHDVVAKLRGILHQKKIGHTGTLDPDATGVLPVCLGRATRVCELLTDSDKIYEAVLRLGVVTDTQDMTGCVLEQHPVNVSPEEIAAVTASFEGAQEQIPPMYSALKVNGRKLVDLAREGRVVERKPRPITIYQIEILDIQLPEVKLRVSCSKGTYIRTLCHDIGRTLGCGGAMQALVRTRAAGFTLPEALTLSQVEAKRDDGSLPEAVIPLERIFCELPAFTVDEEHRKLLANGNPLPVEGGSWSRTQEEKGAAAEGPEQAAVYFPDGSFAAVYEKRPGHSRLRPVKMFL